MTRPLVTLAIALLLVTAAPLHAAPAVSGELSLHYDDNRSNAPDYGLDTGSASLLLAADLRKTHRNQSLWGFAWRARASHEAVAEFDDLSQSAITLEGTVIRATGRGLFDPSWALALQAQYADFDNDQRDRARLRLRLSRNQRISTRLGSRLVLQYRQDSADDDVFDTDQLAIGGDIDWQANRRTGLYVSLRWFDGTVVSTANPTPDIIRYAEAISADEAFGGSAANQIAYRLAADGPSLMLGTNVRLTENTALDLSARYVEQSSRSVDYTRSIITASLLTQF